MEETNEQDKQYYSTPALSKSQIKHWDKRNPWAFWKECSFNPVKPETKVTDAIVMGKLRHMMLFQRDLVLDNFEVNDDLGKSRGNKKWIAAQEESSKLLISTDELTEATIATDAILKHEAVRNLLKYAKVEAPYFWNDKEWDIDCKMRTDGESGTVDGGCICIDLKTTGKDFPKYIDKEGYQYEIGMYSRGLELKYGKPVKQFIHIIQSTIPGDENHISLKITEGTNLEACKCEVDRVVKEIAPRIREWQKTKDERIWLPTLKPEGFEFSTWYDREVSSRME